MHRDPTRAALAALVLVLAGLAGWRWWWQPRAQAAAGRDSTLQGTLDGMTARLGLEASLDTRPIALSWRAPSECVEVYSLRVDEEFRDESVALFLGRAEEHATYLLGLAPTKRASEQAARGAEEVVHARSVLMALSDTTEPTLERDVVIAPTTVGPAAADLACRRRTWDPLEDVLALGWPRLPDHPVRPGDAWQGHPVGGRCHETPCLDDAAEIGEAPCRARPWRERFAGVLLGPAQARPGADEWVVLRSEWDDGHVEAADEGSGRGILTSREAVLGQGRPLFVRMALEHRWAGVTRILELRALDDCTTVPFMGDRLGPDHDDPLALVARVRARLSE